MKKIKNKIKNVLLLLARKLKSVEIQEKQNIQKRHAVFSIGKHTYGSENIVIDRYKGSDNKITIGSYCSIATNVTIITGGIHPVNWVSAYPFRAKFRLEGRFNDGIPYSKGEVIIGNDVWICSYVTILSGITVGNGAVLASNSVITKDVPAYALVGGNPARIIKMRFTESQIKILERIKWWEWKEQKVITVIPYLNSENIDEFIEKYSV